MSYQELLNRYGHPAESSQHTLHLSFVAPDHIKTPADVAQQDKWTERDIKNLEWYLERMKEYRQALSQRYNELETMSYKFRLKLQRRVCHDNTKTYTVTVTKILSDGSEIQELREVYTGKERHKAIARYEALKKSRPGIESEMDIAKGRWEK